MKGLFLAFGLIAALFFQPVYASDVAYSIFEHVSYQSPKSTSAYKCNVNVGISSSYYSKIVSSGSECEFEIKSAIEKLGSPYKNRNAVCTSEPHPSLQNTMRVFCTFEVYYYGPPATWITQSRQAYGTYLPEGDTKSCPPDLFPTYTFGYIAPSESQVSRCYDPNELDNASKCGQLFNSGSILTVGNNTAPLVCKTFDDGSRCAFSLVNQGSTPYYQPNLEKGCFGDAEQIPDYDKNANEPQPQPEQCVPYAGGYACAADPKNYCSSEFECVDGCGYVNGQFICFRDEQCTGASCEPAPVDCTTVPDAPVCKEQQTTPEPSFCEKNPTVESCQSGSNFCKKNPLAPSCQLGGDNGGGSGGGGGFDFTLDYDKLINGMKDAAKTLIDESPIPENTEMDKSLDDENKAIKSDYDTFLEDGVFNEIKATSQRTVFASLENIFPAGSSNCSFTMGEFTIEICSSAEKIRGLLYWVFAILTLIYLRHLFYSTISINAGK